QLVVETTEARPGLDLGRKTPVELVPEHAAAAEDENLHRRSSLARNHCQYSRRPSVKSARAAKPSAAAMRLVLARQWRTSPGRGGAKRTSTRRPEMSRKSSARRLMVRLAPVPTFRLALRSARVAARKFASATSRTCTKSRVWVPSPK